MSKWTLGSYNKFLGAAMTGHGLTRKQAAQMYREVRDKSGKPAFRTYLKQHPRISKRLAERAIMRKPPKEKLPKRKPPFKPEIPEYLGEELDNDQEAESSEDFESPDIR